MGTRLMAGQQTLNLYVEVRLLCAQLFLFKKLKNYLRLGDNFVFRANKNVLAPK